MSLPAERTHALILAGGGASAAYQVGVVRALLQGVSPATNRRRLEPRIFAGTSAGAFNAALLVSAADRGLDTAVDQLERVWLSDVADTRASCGNGVFRLKLDATRFADPACLAANPVGPLLDFIEDGVVLSADLARRGSTLLAANGTLEQRLVELIDVEAFVSIEPFRRVIRRVIAPEAIRRSDRVLQIAAINWKTGALRMFVNEDFTDTNCWCIVQAAAAIPGLFPSVDVDGQPYADASFVANTPLKQPIDAGADVLHVVYFNPNVDSLPLPRLRNTVSTVNRAVLISLGAMMNRDIEIASRVNLALDVMQRGERPMSASETRAVIFETGLRESAGGPGSKEHRHIDIHRYHAREPGGGFQWLSFDRDHVERLIAHGYEETAGHDCVASGCILNAHPDGCNGQCH